MKKKIYNKAFCAIACAVLATGLAAQPASAMEAYEVNQNVDVKDSVSDSIVVTGHALVHDMTKCNYSFTFTGPSDIKGIKVDKPRYGGFIEGTYTPGRSVTVDDTLSFGGVPLTFKVTLYYADRTVTVEKQVSPYDYM